MGNHQFYDINMLYLSVFGRKEDPDFASFVESNVLTADRRDAILDLDRRFTTRKQSSLQSRNARLPSAIGSPVALLDAEGGERWL
jgi:hypothetical protein